MTLIPKLRRRWLVTLTSAGAFATLALLVFSSIWISTTGEGRLTRTAAEVPRGSVALVLGCSPRLSSGVANFFFENRMQAAAALWNEGRCTHFVLSGDNHRRGYDEPTAMKERLMSLGVPESAIVLDYAGFSTFDSIVRARRVFGLKEVCLVTQEDHARRALFLADHTGLKATAFAAEEVSFRFAVRTEIREVFARARAVMDIYVFHREPHFLGPAVKVVGNKTDGQDRSLIFDGIKIR